MSSFTRSNPAALTLECEPCRMTVGANDVRPEWVEMFRTAHSHGGPVFYRCLPCADGQCSACSSDVCECPCEKEKA